MHHPVSLPFWVGERGDLHSTRTEDAKTENGGLTPTAIAVQIIDRVLRECQLSRTTLRFEDVCC